jgi:molybdopterin/thiamine biosynthesis adenylyltransferase
LVLPGIKKYKIVDDKIISKDDIQVNFFTEPGSLGRSRVEVVSGKLAELNEEV